MSSQKVLIVEDEKDVRETIKDILELEGFTVLTAAHGEEALDRLQNDQKICLMLLDLMMPVMNGWQVLEEMNNRPPLAHIPVVVVSAITDLTGIQAQYRCEVMKKPVNISDLIRLVEKHCSQC